MIQLQLEALEEERLGVEGKKQDGLGQRGKERYSANN
jgi:hypothetical protein